MTKNTLGIFALLLGISIPTHSHAKPKPIPVVYFSVTTSDLSSRLAGLCADRNSIVVEQDQLHVLCTRSVEGLAGAFTQVLVGNAYSTPPELKVRFSIIRSNDSIRVQAHQWVETQMAFGQVRQMALDNKKYTENMLTLLEGIGGARTPQ